MCSFSLPFGVGGWLRFVIVALTELLYYIFVNPAVVHAIDPSKATPGVILILCPFSFSTKTRFMLSLTFQ